MVGNHKSLLRTAIISGVAIFSAACSSMDSASIQAAESQDQQATAALMPVTAPTAPVATTMATASPPTQSANHTQAMDNALARIKQLAAAQRTDEAMALTGQLLQRYPDNPDLRLMQGVLLNQMGQTQQAEYVFRQLSEQHPELPEPLNNLAVIYANRGDMNRAISTLQQAFETHPSYARIQSNLRSLYTTLASQAYNRALNLGSQAPTPDLAELDRIAESPSHVANAPARLMTVSQHSSQPLSRDEAAEFQVELVRAAQDRAAQHRAARSGSAQQPEVDAPAAAALIAVTRQAPAVSQQQDRAAATAEPATLAPGGEMASAEPVAPVSTTAPPAANDNLTRTANAETVATNTPADSASNVAAAVEQSLRDWAAAWSDQDITAYLAYYVDDYRPDQRTSHQDWVKQRNQRLKRPKFIKVTVDRIELRMLDENRAETVFEQHYRADRYQDTVTKTIRWQRVGERWLIASEQSD
ncbi:nuclear transport factor 2 family protein [Marinobacterium arenosum]|uniref:nuclear transport factor 2 family protein n=1 Tax=Marinobacterium arenosum TaxID=2862496 RepID=UPI001C97ACF7|nr:nuclear transport factor 2 family protein [Marinobacterium arenosum]MBY4676000.1 tetratricopeptide repeat protein [Marinobacterium arenosum]